MTEDEMQRAATDLLIKMNITDFLRQTDEDFYMEVRQNLSDEDFEDFCREFPAAKRVLSQKNFFVEKRKDEKE